MHSACWLITHAVPTMLSGLHMCPSHTAGPCQVAAKAWQETSGPVVGREAQGMEASNMRKVTCMQKHARISVIRSDVSYTRAPNGPFTSVTTNSIQASSNLSVQPVHLQQNKHQDRRGRGEGLHTLIDPEKGPEARCFGSGFLSEATL